MAIVASATQVVPAQPRDVLELVLDLERYKQIDTKIRKIYENPPIPDDGIGTVVFRGALRGLPGPRQRERVELVRWESVTYTSDGLFLADLMMAMQGSFGVESGPDGTLVTHSYQFDFKGPVAPIMDRFCGKWLQRDLEAELVRMSEHFGTGDGAGAVGPDV